MPVPDQCISVTVNGEITILTSYQRNRGCQ